MTRRQFNWQVKRYLTAMVFAGKSAKFFVELSPTEWKWVDHVEKDLLIRELLLASDTKHLFLNSVFVKEFNERYNEIFYDIL